MATTDRDVRLVPKYDAARGVLHVKVAETKNVHPAVFRLKVMPAGHQPLYDGVCRPADTALPIGPPPEAVPGVLYRSNEITIPVKDADEATAATGKIRAGVANLCRMLASRADAEVWSGWAVGG